MSSKQLLNTIANKLSSKNFYCLGRFSEWEYFNMDAAIESAMRLADQLSK
jgi:UDP-galactopyranose mutase